MKSWTLLALWLWTASAHATEVAPPPPTFDHDAPVLQAVVAGRAAAAVLATADATGRVRLRTLDGRALGAVTVTRRDPLLAATHDPPAVWIASEQARLEVLDPVTRHRTEVALPVAGAITQLVASPDGTHLVAAVGDWLVRFDPHTRLAKVVGKAGLVQQVVVTDRGWIVARTLVGPRAWQPDDRMVPMQMDARGRSSDESDTPPSMLVPLGDVVWQTAALRAVAWRLTTTAERGVEMPLREPHGCLALPGPRPSLRCLRETMAGLPTIEDRLPGAAPVNDRDAPVRQAVLAPDGRLVVQTSLGFFVQAADQWQPLRPEVETVKTTAVSRDGLRLVVAWQSGTVTTHALPDGRPLGTWPALPDVELLKVGIATDGSPAALDVEGQTWHAQGQAWRKVGPPLGFMTLLASPLPTGEAWLSWASDRADGVPNTGVWSADQGVRAVPLVEMGDVSLDDDGRVHIGRHDSPLESVVDASDATAMLLGTTCGMRAALWDARGERAAVSTWDHQLCIVTTVPLASACTPSDEVAWLWSEDGTALLTRRPDKPWLMRDARTLAIRGKIAPPTEGFDDDDVLAWQDRRLVMLPGEGSAKFRVLDLETRKWTTEAGLPGALVAILVRARVAYRQVKSELARVLQPDEDGGESEGNLEPPGRFIRARMERNDARPLLESQVKERVQQEPGTSRGVQVSASTSARFAVVVQGQRIQVRQAGDLAVVLEVPGTSAHLDPTDRFLLVDERNPALWSVRERRKLVDFGSQRCGLAARVFAQHGRWLVAQADDGLRAAPWRETGPWVALTAPPMARFRRGIEVTPLRTAQDVARVAVVGRNRVQVHDLGSGREPQELPRPFDARKVLLSADGQRVVILEKSCAVRVQDVGQPARTYALPVTCQGADLLLTGADGRRVLVVQPALQQALLLDTQTGQWRPLAGEQALPAGTCDLWPESGVTTCKPVSTRETAEVRDVLWRRPDGEVAGQCPFAQTVRLGPGVVGCRRPGGGLELVDVRVPGPGHRLALTTGQVARLVVE
jgi:hypothetical protein